MKDWFSVQLDMAARMMEMGERTWNPILAERTAPTEEAEAAHKQQKEGNNG